MSRNFLFLGALLLLATVILWIAGPAEWVSEHAADTMSAISLKAGLVLIAASFALRLMSPVAKQISKSHCKECGRPVARGHIYCLDHLQETVHATRDRTHDVSKPTMRRRA